MRAVNTEILPRIIGGSLQLLVSFAALICILFIFSIGIDRIPVTDRDEARYAQASKQMSESGDLLDIRFQDGTRYQKPIGIYWAQTAASHSLDAVGSNEIWVYRIPSIIAATLACAAVYWAGKPLVGSAAAGLATLMMATTLLLQAEARIAKTDAALLLSVVVAMGALARIWLGHSLNWWTQAVFWTALAAGFLIKGPLIFAPVFGVIFWIAATRREVNWLKNTRPLHGITWMLVIVLPWFIAIIWISEGAFVVDSIAQDFAAKIGIAQESHGAPPGTYLFIIWFTAWPWSILIPAASVATYTGRRKPETAFLIGWIVPMWIALEFVPTKLAHYPLPVFPAIMLLAAAVLIQRPQRLALHLGVFMWVIAGTLFSAVALVAPIYFGNGVNPPAVIMVFSALLSGGLGIRWLYKQDVKRASGGLIASGALMAVGTFAITLPALHELQVSEKLTAATECHDGAVHLVGYHEPSAVFRMGTHINLSTYEEAFAALKADDAAIAWVGVETPITNQTISGFNYSKADPVTLQLFVAPGIPSPDPLCKEDTK